MSRRAAHLAIAAVTAVVVPSALAKGPDTARICGDSGCATIDAVSDVNTLALFAGGFEPRSEPRPAPFFTVELTSSYAADAVRWSFLYVPSAQALKIVRADFSGGVYDAQTTDSWVSVNDATLAAYRRATAVMSPFPSSPAWLAPEPAERDTPWLLIALVLAAVAVAAALAHRPLRTFSRRTPPPPRTTRA